MKQYQDLVRDVLENGTDSDDRTGTGTLSLFGRQIRFDLEQGFPLVTLKKTYWKGVVIELLWMLSGDTNIGFLNKHDVRIWDSWSNEKGDLGPIYSAQWRKWKSSELQSIIPGGGLSSMDYVRIDQIKKVIEQIKSNPNSRRLIVNTWNVGDLDEMALAPCHCFFQFYVRDGKLSCQLYQRSADLFLGVPFNIASYALLTMLIARETNLKLGEFVHTFGDVHLYKNHLDQARELLKRTPKPLPRVNINTPSGGLLKFVDEMLPDLTWQDISDNIELIGYKSHSTLKGSVSV